MLESLIDDFIRAPGVESYYATMVGLPSMVIKGGLARELPQLLQYTIKFRSLLLKCRLFHHHGCRGT